MGYVELELSYFVRVWSFCWLIWAKSYTRHPQCQVCHSYMSKKHVPPNQYLEWQIQNGLTLISEGPKRSWYHLLAVPEGRYWKRGIPSIPHIPLKHQKRRIAYFTSYIEGAVCLFPLKKRFPRTPNLPTHCLLTVTVLCGSPPLEHKWQIKTSSLGIIPIYIYTYPIMHQFTYDTQK